jgi:hypothetical protein
MGYQVVEVNVMLASVHFGGYTKTITLNFQKCMSNELIFNPYTPQKDNGEP